MVNAFCPPRHLEPLPLFFGQAAPMRVQIFAHSSGLSGGPMGLSW